MKSYNYHAKAKKFMRLIHDISEGKISEEETDRKIEKEIKKPWPDMRDDLLLAMACMTEYLESADKDLHNKIIAPNPEEQEPAPWLDEIVTALQDEGADDHVAYFRGVKANALLIKGLAALEQRTENSEDAAAACESDMEFIEKYFLSIAT